MSKTLKLASPLALAALLALTGCTSTSEEESEAPDTTVGETSETEANPDSDSSDETDSTATNKSVDADSEKGDKTPATDKATNNGEITESTNPNVAEDADPTRGLDESAKPNPDINTEPYDETSNPNGLTVVCQHDPELGPNPFGMRSFLTFEEYGDDTIVRLEGFGNAIGDGAFTNAEYFANKSAMEVFRMFEEDESLLEDVAGEGISFKEIQTTFSC